MNKVFNPDNLFFRMLARGVDIVGLSLCWALLCLPVVTAGSSTAALYYTVVKVFRQKDDRAFKLFFKSFVGTLKRGIPLTIICEIAAVILAYGYYIMQLNSTTNIGVIMYMAYYVILVVPIGFCCYLFTLLGRFDMKVGDLARTAFALAMRHLPTTVVQVLLVAEVVVFIVNYWWPVLFAPALLALLCSLFQEKIFIKYLSEEDKMALNPNYEQEEEEKAAMKAQWSERKNKMKKKKNKSASDDN